MLIKESQLRAIIREELIRENQELMLEFSIKKIADNVPKVMPALVFMITANVMTACNVLKSEEVSEAEQAAIELGVLGSSNQNETEQLAISLGIKVDPNLLIDESSADTIDDLRQVADDGRKYCKDGLRYMEENKIENEGLEKEFKNAITALEKVETQLDKRFLPKDQNAAKNLVKTVKTKGISICKYLNGFLKDFPKTFKRLGKEQKKRKK